MNLQMSVEPDRCCGERAPGIETAYSADRFPSFSRTSQIVYRTRTLARIVKVANSTTVQTWVYSRVTGNRVRSAAIQQRNGKHMSEGKSSGDTTSITEDEIEIGGRRFVNAWRLASILGVSARTLSRWDAAGTGPPRIKVGRKVLFDLLKISDWLTSREK